MSAPEPKPSSGLETELETGPEAISRVLRGLHPHVTIEGNSGRAVYEPEAEHRGNPGWLHGGFAATLLDHISARVAGAALGGSVVTGKLDLRYVRPVSLVDGPYELEASYKPAKPGRSIRYMVRVQASLRDAEGSLVEANSLFVPRPQTVASPPES